MEITNINQLDLNKTYSYADYLTWKFAETVELLRGKIVAMAALKSQHQDLVGNLFGEFRTYLKGKPCRAYIAPFDVRLYNENKSLIADRDIYTVVQPDVCVVCDMTKVSNNGCLGAPDLVIEVVSKSTLNRDLHEKKELYAEAGVTEYWLAFPDSRIVLTHILQENGQYSDAKVFSETDHLTPHIFPDFSIDLADVFDFPEEY